MRELIDEYLGVILELTIWLCFISSALVLLKELMPYKVI